MLLQKISFSYSHIQKLRNLYYTVLNGNSRIENSILVLDADSKISFNSYFNSFYESYWRSYTDINSICINIRISGRGLLSIYRDSKVNGCYELKSLSFNTNEFESFMMDIDLTDNLFNDMGRIFIDIMAFDEVRISGIEISSNINLIDKKLTIGICTFNREDFLYKNLKSLLEFSREFKNLSSILIVNQGDDFTDPNLINLINNNRNIFRLFKQNNLGGTGGFTRTLFEASNIGISDFHLLMDDDVVVDVNIIRTAFNFASLASKPIAVGGQMLDMLRPSTMHEYGARVDNKGYITPIFANKNVGDLIQLIDFNSVTNIDYNAWWFCLIPTKCIKQVKLPAPIFIRGDDQEYGLRLKENNIETIALPGVALWHEPFYTKVGGWQTYYDFRNRMILASSYKSMRNEKVEQLFLKIYKFLLCHDYQSVVLILQAIKDFSLGTKLMNESSDIIHARIVQLAKEHAPQSVNVNFKPISDEKVKVRWTTKDRRINFTKQIGLLSTLDFSEKPPKHLWDRHVSPENIECYPYVKSNGIQSYHYLYKPNKTIFRNLLTQIMQATYIYSKAIRNNDWSSIDKNKTEEYWSDIFKKNE